MWTVSVRGVSVGWMSAGRGSGRHLIKKVAAHLRQLDFSSWGLGNGVGECGHEWRSVDVYFL